MKKINILFLAIMLFNIAIIEIAFADLDTLVKNVFPAGVTSNVTNASIVEEQTAGHLVGGSLMIKSANVPDLQPLYFQAPTCKLGGLPCAAQFDIRAGALSFIKTAELERFLKQIVQNVGAYAGIMLIKSVCPQCENIMTYLEQMQRDINGMNFNACQVSTLITNGMFNKQTVAAEQNRQTAMVLNGGGSDMNDIRQRSIKDSADVTKTTPELESQLGDNFNLVWQALSKKGGVSGNDDLQLRQLLMSISGTIIVTKDKDQAKWQPLHKKSLIDKDLIKDFIGKGADDETTIKLYVCDENKYCLHPEIMEQKIKSGNGLYKRLEKLIMTIIDKIYTNQGKFTTDEETLIALSSLPIINKIERDLALYANKAYISLRQPEFIEALCFDVVSNYMITLLKEVSEVVDELEYLQIADNKVFEKFDRQVQQNINNISKAKYEALKHYDMISRTKTMMRQEDSYYEMKFQEFFNNYK
ncbi:MAG: conjugal transfer protein TraH [Rickettsiaceae bacterium]|nr:conjugal transfer protein TraH [Rickettsiaceae bacterium]